jgi:hypothetical protein
MKKGRITIFMIVLLSCSAIPLSFFAITGRSANINEYDYIGVDWKSGLAGKVTMPEFDPASAPMDFETYSSDLSIATPEVGYIAYDWYTSAVTWSGNPYIQLRAVREHVEVWVALDLAFPDGDSRNDDPYNMMISDEMCEYLADEFEDTIYPTCVDNFGAPFDRDGTGTIFEA